MRRRALWTEQPRKYARDTSHIRKVRALSSISISTSKFSSSVVFLLLIYLI